MLESWKPNFHWLNRDLGESLVALHRLYFLMSCVLSIYFELCLKYYQVLLLGNN